MDFLGRPGLYYSNLPNFRPMAVPMSPENLRYSTTLLSYPRCTCECYCGPTYDTRTDAIQRYATRRQELRALPNTKEIGDVFLSGKPGRRNRTTYKRWQIDELEHAFLINPYPTSVYKKSLALRLGLRDSRVQVWFQNRRAKSKRDHQSPGSPEYTAEHLESDHQSESTSICTEDSEKLDEESDNQIESTRNQLEY